MNNTFNIVLLLQALVHLHLASSSLIQGICLVSDSLLVFTNKDPLPHNACCPDGVIFIQMYDSPT